MRPDGARNVERLRAELERAVTACLRGSGGDVAAQLSGGLDSSAVVVTAARALAPSGGRLTAYTAVPRSGSVEDGFPGRVADEGPMASRTAAMYANVESVAIAHEPRPTTDLLDEEFELYERPSLNPFNMLWIDAINAAAKAQDLTIMLTGQMGNLTISYPGWERLPALVGQGRVWAFIRLAMSLIRAKAASPRMILHMLRPRIKPRIEQRRRRAALILQLSANNPATLDALLDDDASATTHNSLSTRLRTLASVDPGNFNKAVLAKYGIDTRDPTADRRVVELCLSLPLDEFLDTGGPRRLAQRLLQGHVPPSLLAERRKGVQAADWYLDLDAARSAVACEVDLLSRSGAAARVVDIPRLRALVANWPTDWTEPATMQSYRLTLQRALAVGHFLRRADEAAHIASDDGAAQ